MTYLSGLQSEPLFAHEAGNHSSTRDLDVIGCDVTFYHHPLSNVCLIARQAPG